MAAKILSLDQGTTSSRAIVFDAELTPIGFGQKELPQHFPAPGWVEHDPDHIWSTTVATAREAIVNARTMPPTLPPSASPTSAKPASSGTGVPAGPSTAPSSGRTGARPTPASA